MLPMSDAIGICSFQCFSEQEQIIETSFFRTQNMIFVAAAGGQRVSKYQKTSSSERMYDFCFIEYFGCADVVTGAAHSSLQAVGGNFSFKNNGWYHIEDQYGVHTSKVKAHKGFQYLGGSVYHGCLSIDIME